MSEVSLLVVDDEEIILQIYKRVFGEEDYKVFAVPECVQAIDVLNHQPIDLILTDMKMPEISGTALITYASIRYSHIPVVVVSAHARYKDIAGNNPNVRAFLEKPVDLDVLKRTVGDLLKKK